ncbi:MAG: class I SAM-dependent methyltransferase [Desulfobacteraceae bacterium]|jgi:D-alanine-D-alanine ligase
MAEFDPDWWKRIFDETYLITDARSVCDDELTCKEVDFLEEVLKVDSSWPVLDLCGGQGRHGLELSRRGFKDVTVLDYSEYLINQGKEKAQQEGLNTFFIREDARDTDLASERFKIIVVMASSFGYFVDECENEKILFEANRLLMPEGKLLLDLPNKDYVLKNFNPESWHEADDDVVVCRQRRLEEDILYSREKVISKSRGGIRDETYCTRLYSEKKIVKMLVSCGFSSIDVQKDYMSHEKKGDYGCMTNRMIVIAHKK